MTAGRTLLGTLLVATLALAALVLAALVLAALGGACDDAFAGTKKGEKTAAELAFETGYDSEDAKARADAVAALAEATDAIKVDVISRVVVPREKRADVLARAVGVLGRVRDEAAVAELVGLAGRGKVEQRVVYLEALASIDGTAPHNALLAAVKDREPRIRGMAAYGLGMHRAGDALDALLVLLSDSAWQVQSAAIEALPRLEAKDALKAQAVPALVDMLDDYTGRIAVDASEALARICGRRLGRDAQKWRRFLAGEDVVPEGAVRAGGPGAGGDGDDDVGEAPPPTEYASQSERPHFYGMEVVSNRVVLLLDVSLSMNDPIEIDRDRLRRETSQRRAVTGDGAQNAQEPEDEDHAYDIPWWRIKTRLDLAREQTILLVSQLHEDQFFDIVFFSTEVEPWMGRLVPANSANRQKAIAALNAIKPDDKTNTWGALAAAFDLMGNEKKSYEMGPDELYLVTDGQPSIGDIVDMDQILEAVLQLHKTKPIRVNCIGIGVNLRFMKKMCRATGGQAKFFE